MVKRNTYRVGSAIISALESGNSGNPIALFLHGIPASAELWRSVLEYLGELGWHCIAPDCPGYGQTVVTLDMQYRLEGTAALFIDWIKQEDFKDIWLIGHDIGGGIAQIMLTQEERLFRQLSLSNCATARTWPVPMVRLMQWTASLGLFPFMARTGVVQLLGGLSLRRTFYNKKKLRQELKERIFFDTKINNAEGQQKFAKLLRHLTSDSTMDNMGKLSKIKTKVHLIWAMKDPFQSWKKSGQILVDTLPNIMVSELKNTGHFLQLDNTDFYIKVLLSGAPSYN